ncbi:phenylalanine--tRNA ligase subunit beta [Myxococcota bacterium]|nr:phenylalanine--tRNA ligase subunit beta [Myxococcota bacterium]
MKVSWSWISRFAEVGDIDAVGISLRFTLGVAEIDEVLRVGVPDPALTGEARAEALSRVKIAKVVACRPHPQAEKLQIVTVDDGGGTPREIVSGAPNVRPGLLSVFADESAVIVGKDGAPTTLQEAVIRGVPSRGMLVSFTELGIGDDHAGVIEVPDAIAPGTLLSAAAPAFDDVLWDIDNKSLTHRPDCWGHVGLAREIAAMCRRAFTWRAPDVTFTAEADIAVRDEAPDLCPRYSCYSMEGIRIGPSPLWLQILLWRLGQRPINNLVDFTNLTMLTVGNPLHAFDRRQLEGDTIVIRRAAEGEPFTTLDGRAHRLTAGDLVIADARKPVALAGVMGGENSMVADDTTRIVLESANFHAGTIRRTAVRTQERTDSSARFEKSLDPHLVRDASLYFADLVLTNIPGSRVSSRYEDVFPAPPAPKIIHINGEFVKRRLGMEITAAQVAEVLERLQFTVARDGEELTVTVPTFRATKDIGIPEDLVEEVGRWHGYDNIEAHLPSVAMARPFTLPIRSVVRRLREALCSESGFLEAMTYSFNRLEDVRGCRMDPDAHLWMENPISTEEPVLRTSLFPNLLAAVIRNERRESRQRLAEFGRVYLPDPAATPSAREPWLSQPRMAGLVLSDRHADISDTTLFFQMKDAVLRGLRTQERGSAAVAKLIEPPPVAHPARCASVTLGGAPVGWIAQVHPMVRRELGLESVVVMACIDLDAIAALPKVVVPFSPLPRFPGMEYDLTALVPKTVSADDIIRALRDLAPEITRDVTCFAVYESPKFPDRRSLSFRLHLAHKERTLTQEELLELHGKAVQTVQKTFDAQVAS